MRIEDNFRIRTERFQSKFEGTNEEEVVTNNAEFSDVLKKCINDVNESSIVSGATTSAFVRGEDVSIDEVMVKASEASLNLQFLTTTRDKLVEGYKELIKMQ